MQGLSNGAISRRRAEVGMVFQQFNLFGHLDGRWKMAEPLVPASCVAGAYWPIVRSRSRSLVVDLTVKVRWSALRP